MIKIKNILNTNEIYRRPHFKLDAVRLKSLNLYKDWIFLFILELKSIAIILDYGLMLFFQSKVLILQINYDPIYPGLYKLRDIL